MTDQSASLTSRVEALREFLKVDRRYAYRVGGDQAAVDQRTAAIDDHLATLNALSKLIRS